jgi:geranylgeranyl reductase family protein
MTTVRVGQVPVRDVKEREWEAIVVGAGPAGSMTALHLARKGHRVLLVDRQAFPREKVCGDALIPDSIAGLKRAGLWETIRAEGFSPALAVAYSPSRHSMQVPGDYLTIKRERLDHLLARSAASDGALFCKGRVASLTKEAGGVALAFEGDNRPFRARIAVVATGADVALTQSLDLVERPAASAVAMRCYVRSSMDLDRLVVAYDRSTLPGYAWIFPMGKGEFNVGCGVVSRYIGQGVNLREVYERFTHEFPLAKELMAKADGATPLKGAKLRCGLQGTRPTDGAAVLAVGETIGATFPYTGEGIGKAMETGEKAAELVHQALEEGRNDALLRFPRWLEKDLKPRYVGYEVAERWFSRPWLNDLITRRASSSRFLRGVLPDIFAERADPRLVFSLTGLAKILMGF